MKKNVVLMVLTILSVFSLFACGSKMPKELKAEEIQEETLYIKADGSNQVAYLESFEEDYYNVEELKAFMDKELKPYNEKYGENVVTISELELSGKNVVAVLNFLNNKAYAEFSKKLSNKPISYPTFNKIMQEYGDLDFNSVKEEGIQKGSKVINSDKHNVVVITGPILLMTEKKIQYYSAGKLVDENRLRLDEGDEAVVVFSR